MLDFPACLPCWPYWSDWMLDFPASLPCWPYWSDCMFHFPACLLCCSIMALLVWLNVSFPRLSPVLALLVWLNVSFPRQSPVLLIPRSITVGFCQPRAVASSGNMVYRWDDTFYMRNITWSNTFTYLSGKLLLGAQWPTELNEPEKKCIKQELL